jgi:hypothetical protein
VPWGRCRSESWSASRHHLLGGGCSRVVQDRGTFLPGNEFFAGDIGIVASASTWKRAKVFLAAAGVIYSNDGPYQVA